MQLGLGPLYRLYETGDGWLCLAAVTEQHRRALGDVTPVESLEPWFAGRSSREAFETLDAAGVPVEICDDDFPLHVFDDPEMWAKGLVVRHQHPKLGWFENFGTTMNFSATPSRVWAPPPICGQHTREIMHSYGYADGDIDKLIEARGIFEDLWVD